MNHQQPMRRLPRFLFLFLCVAVLVLFASQPLLSQDDQACTDLVERTLVEIGSNCDGLGRNSACYGFNRVDVTFTDVQPVDFFSQPSDRGNLSVFANIRSAPLNTACEQWGAATLKVQAANIPDTIPGQSIIFILLGDSETQNAVPPEEAFLSADPPVRFRTANRTNLRSGSSLLANVITTVAPSRLLLTEAISPDAEWLRVVYDEQATWINRAVLNASVVLEEQFDALPVLEEDSRAPMQSFYLRTGIGRTPCGEAPDLLVTQGPENFEVNISANGADINISSTVVLRTLTHTEPTVLSGHEGGVTATDFSPDNHHVASADEGGTVRLWNVPMPSADESSESLRVRLLSRAGALEVDELLPVTALSFGYDGDLLAALDAGGMVWLWELATGALATIPFQAPESDVPAITSLAFAPGEPKLATGYSDGVVQVWDLINGLEDITLLNRLENGDTPIHTVSFGADDQTLFVACGDGFVRIYNLETGDRRGITNERFRDATAAVFNPDGELLGYALPNGRVELRDMVLGRRFTPVSERQPPISSLALGPHINPYSNVLPLATGDEDGVAEVLELCTTQCGPTRRTILSGHSGMVNSLSFSGDGKRLATGGADGTVHVWELAPYQMQVFTVQGEAGVDGLPVPAGHTTIGTLLYDPDAGWELSTGDWTIPRPWTPEEYDYLEPIIDIPDNILHYPIVLPDTPVAQEPPVQEIPPDCEPRTDWTGRYTVRVGDALASIAAAYNLDTETLQLGNCIVDPDIINPGQVLRVPYGGVPVVGETGCIVVFDGDWQITPINTQFGRALQAQLRDNAGNPLPEVNVTFHSPGMLPGGFFPDTVFEVDVMTDGEGIATAPDFTASQRAGSYIVWATSTDCGNDSAVFNLINLPGPPFRIVPIAGDNQQTNVGNVFPVNLGVQVLDEGDNPTPDITVTFTAPNYEPSGRFPDDVLTAEVVTDYEGKAVAPPFTGICPAGTYEVQATVPEVSEPAIFNLENTHIVTTLDDDGPGSLRQLLRDSCAGDRIILDVTGTIVLTSGELVLTTDVTIVGPGAGNLTISGSNASRVFQVASGVINISGLTIANGNGSTGGGGILQTGGTLTIINSVISGNTAAFDGGGIYQIGGVLTISGSTISGNYAPGGGGDGGGIHTFGSTTTISNSTISGNTADFQGGGIFNAGSTLVINGSTISGNDIWGVAACGGGVWSNSNTTISNSVISGNNANDGPGGGICNTTAAGILNINNTTFTGNTNDLTFIFDGNVVYHAVGAPTTNFQNTTIVITGWPDCSGGGVFNDLGGNTGGDTTCY